MSATARGGRRAKTLTCGFDLARFSILIQASSRSFDLAFSLRREERKKQIHKKMKPSEQPAADVRRPLVNREGKPSGRLLVFLSPELLCAIIKELLVHLHEELQGVVDEAVDGPGNTANTFASTGTRPPIC